MLTSRLLPNTISHLFSLSGSFLASALGGPQSYSSGEVAGISISFLLAGIKARAIFISWWGSKKDVAEMGNCCSEEVMVYPEDLRYYDGERREEKEEEDQELEGVKRVCRVKLRMTTTELMELAAQAKSGVVIGPMLLSKCLASGNFEVKELSPAGDDGGRREKEMNRLWTIKEEEEEAS